MKHFARRCVCLPQGQGTEKEKARAGVRETGFLFASLLCSNGRVTSATIVNGCREEVTEKERVSEAERERERVHSYEWFIQ